MQAPILVVEDAENETFLIRRALESLGIPNPIAIVRNTEEAMAYFMGSGAYKNRSECPLPSLVLLDLKMPGMSSIEFLRWLRQQPGYGATRVVVLASSTLTQDVNAACQAGANSFLLKPVHFERSMEVTSALSGYCRGVGRLLRKP